MKRLVETHGSVEMSVEPSIGSCGSWVVVAAVDPDGPGDTCLVSRGQWALRQGGRISSSEMRHFYGAMMTRLGYADCKNRSSKILWRRMGGL